MLLFPEVSVPKDGLTILTVCKHTDNDMSTWSSSVEEERDSLTKKVILFPSTDTKLYASITKPIRLSLYSLLKLARRFVQI